MTRTIIAMVLAAGCGLGLFIALRGLRRRPPELADLVVDSASRLTETTWSVPVLYRAPPDDLGPLQRYLSRPGLRLLEMFGLTDQGLLRQQLRVLDRSIERHAYEKMLAGVTGVVLPLLLGVVLAAGGTTVSPLLLVLAAVVLGGLGFLYPDLPLAERVARRQQAFRHSLSSYLDLVTIILAGGGGTESALVGAANAGDGWVFAEIRSALRRGELTGRTPWEMFEELGIHYGIDELRELASSVSLAGGHGARVRQSLVAKSEALRTQQTAEIETKAESNTEKMIVPVSVMVLGLMVFIGRGAVEAIGAGPGDETTTSTNEGAQP
ncbi:MAG: type II secretion system F family protein [Actinomycetota bacterium]